jgi:membrane-bound lytic murein transglycosylase D
MLMSAPHWRLLTAIRRYGVPLLLAIAIPTLPCRAADDADEGTSSDSSGPGTGQQPSTLADDGGDEKAVTETGDSSSPAPSTPAAAVSERQAILDRLNCEAVEPTECLIPEDPFGDVQIEAAFTDPDGNSVPVSEASVDALLEAVGRAFADREGDRVVAAGNELIETRFAELQYFGVEDHFVDPPYDYYRDPVKSVTRVPMLYLDQIDPADFDYPIVVNEKVQNWMVYLLTRGRKHFVKWIGRKQRYEPLIIESLAERGMPTNLIYQAMIESGFSPYAYSWAKAAGVWQFIPGTGKRYGMRIDWWVDQRRDPYEATRGALDYMERLHEMFGDWWIASSAYNAGEGKMGKAIRRYETDDFWEICAGDYLKPETKNYVPKMIAAMILGTYPERYGLLEDVPEWLDPWEFEMVTVSDATDVGLIAELTGSTEDAIMEMNPELRRWCTPPGVAWDVKVPLGSAEDFHAKLAEVPDERKLSFKRHKVARGESLSKIAANYGVTVKAITTMNSVRNANSIAVGTYLVIPVRASSGTPRDLTHSVERGESLSIIASRYGVTVSDIKEWNELKSDVIHRGDMLKVQLGGGAPAEAVPEAAVAVAAATTPAPTPAPKRTGPKARKAEQDAVADAAEKAAEHLQSEAPPEGDRKAAKKTPKRTRKAAASRSSDEEPMVHTVVRGDTLGEIGEHYDVTIAKLKSWNRLKRDTILVGQELTVYPGPRSETRKLVHTVKRGDSLWKIAHKHGVSVDELQSWNALGGSSTIHAGDRLVVYTGGGGRAAATPARARARTVTHKVLSGESLWSISQRYDVTIDAIKKWNGLKRDTLKIGQTLTLKLK